MVCLSAILYILFVSGSFAQLLSTTDQPSSDSAVPSTITSSAKQSSSAQSSITKFLSNVLLTARQFDIGQFNQAVAPTVGGILVVASVALVALGMGMVATGLAAGRRRSLGSASSFDVPLRWIAMARELYEDHDVREPDCYRRMICEMQEQEEYSGLGKAIRNTLDFVTDLNDYVSLPTGFQAFMFDVSDAVAKGIDKMDCAKEYSTCQVSMKDFMVRYGLTLTSHERDTANEIDPDYQR